jgi:methionyl-tRNA synthetase
MSKSIFISTSIPYVNAFPHIGHALEFVQTDVIARYQKLLGNDVFFLSGTDENALKNVQSAKKAGVPTIDFVQKNSKRFYDLKDALNISFDDFIQTTEERHFKGAQKLWLSFKKEDIYKKNYKGLYCVGCEQFYTPDELIDGKCPEHLTVPQEISEENYFFKLSNYQKKIEELISSDTLRIIPQTKKNEILSFVKSGLQDFSISRSVERAQNWGVLVPGDSSQIMYVWVDALSNYITALDYYHEGELYEKYWKNSKKRIHVIGKGIIRFHAVYWIAMLLSAGISLPTEEFVHGYVTVNGGEKISKSLGNVIDPFDVVKKYGTDATRYYLLREIPAYGDGDFSFRRFEELFTSDLSNGLGNLVSRVAKLAEGLEFSSHTRMDFIDKKFIDYHRALEEYRFNDALSFVWNKIKKADENLNTTTPWKLTGDKKYKALEFPVSEIYEIVELLSPLLPSTSDKIKERFGKTISYGEPLFPRI